MTRSIRRSIVPLFVLACLLLGGSTRSHWANMTLQLGAIALLAYAALAPVRVEAGRHGRALAIMAGAMILIIVIQLIPLPPGVWTMLPGRGAIAAGFDLLRLPQPYLTWSLAPYATMASALWLLPPLAVLAAMLRPGAYRESWLAIAVLTATFAGVVLGALQVASPDPLHSPWYLYPVTNNGQPAGLFANSNHMAILMVCAMPFVVALYGARSSRRGVQASAGKVAILGGAMLVLIVGMALNRSLAGIGLAIPVFAASLLVREPVERPRTRRGLAAVGLLAVLAVAAMFATPLNNNLTAAGAAQDYSSRYTSFSNSLRAVWDHFPAGSGVGSFADLYPRYENPEIVDNWFINHVHNDYIELALETGLPGMLLIAAFLLWWVGRTIALWRAPIVDPFARAATLASAALLAHSMVEFPLRGSGIASLFAMCIGLMVAPRRLGRTNADKVAGQDDRREARHLGVE